MNHNSLKRIEETVIPSAKWVLLEIAQDSIYLDFSNVELGNPKLDKDLPLSIRFAKDSFISFFYNNIWDIEFISSYDFNNQSILEEFSFKVKEFKFLDFHYLDEIFNSYKKEKTISINSNIDVHNIRSDFFLLFETNELAIVIGGNQMNFFNNSEKLDDNLIKELSNQWVLHYLDYWSNKKSKNDPMCEKHPLK